MCVSGLCCTHCIWVLFKDEYGILGVANIGGEVQIRDHSNTKYCTFGIKCNHVFIQFVLISTMYLRNSPLGARDLSLFRKTSGPTTGLTPCLKQWIPGAHSPGVNRPERGGENNTPSSTEVKNEWSCTSTFCVFVMYVGTVSLIQFIQSMLSHM
jgi:hypothetical protein